MSDPLSGLGDTPVVDEPPAGQDGPPPPAGPPAGGWSFPAPPPAAPGMPPTAERRRFRRLAVAALIGGAVVIAAGAGVGVSLLTRGSTPAPASPTRTPAPASGSVQAARSLYERALAATRSSPGFHYVAVSTGAATQRIVGDAGQHDGRQLITFDASYGAERFTLVLVAGVVYFQGNTPAVEDQLGVPAAKAAGVQGRWVSVSAGDGPYGVLAPGITTSDQAQELELVPTSTAPIATPRGGPATRILGTIPAQQGVPTAAAHLDIATTSDQPISYASAASAGNVSVTSGTTFSRWGTAPTVSAPAGAVAWSSLGASEPPGGYGSGGGGAQPSSSPQGVV